MTNDIKPTLDDLQSKLDNTLIPEGIIKEISTKESAKAVRGVIFDVFHLGALEKVFDTAERIKGEMQEYKKGLLMQAYMEHVDDLQVEVDKLREFAMSPEGNILFTKVIRILSDNPLNSHYAKLFGF